MQSQQRTEDGQVRRLQLPGVILVEALQLAVFRRAGQALEVVEVSHSLPGGGRCAINNCDPRLSRPDRSTDDGAVIRDQMDVRAPATAAIGLSTLVPAAKGDATAASLLILPSC